jgi:hypothetical protein
MLLGRTSSKSPYGLYSNKNPTAATYWLATTGYPTTNIPIGPAIIDASGSMYFAGINGSAMLLFYVLPSGNVIWEKSITFTGQTITDIGVPVVDAYNNVYIPVYTLTHSILCKFNSSGSLIWNTQTDIGNLLYDASRQLITVVADTSQTTTLTMYTLDGAFVHRILIYTPIAYQGTGRWDIFSYNMTIGSGNIHMVGTRTNDITVTADNLYYNLVLDSAGVLQSSSTYKYYPSSGTTITQEIWGSVASKINTDIFYVCGVHKIADINYAYIGKFNINGTVIWEKYINNTSISAYFSMDIDSADNLYIVGYVNASGIANHQILISSYNSSGTHLWSNEMDIVPTSMETGTFIKISGTTAVIHGATSITGDGPIIAVVPMDGSIPSTGDYQLQQMPITYRQKSGLAFTSLSTTAVSLTPDIVQVTSITPVTAAYTIEQGSTAFYVVRI